MPDIKEKARMATFVLPKPKSHCNAARSRQCPFAVVVRVLSKENGGRRTESAKSKASRSSATKPSENSSELSLESDVAVLATL